MNDGSSLMDSPLNRPALPEKALWYQEVLSLDPNSRIFLPYARLLAELGRGTEAVEVLKAGLLRHPEFLEARLLLIELLHTSGQDAAAGFEADGIIEQLSQSSALWQIWSRRPGLRADQAAMLLFFGSSLKANSHSLADVFEAGIAALTGGNGTPPATACPAPGILGETPPAPAIPQTPAVERPENAAPVDAQLSAGSPALTKAPAAPAENTALRQDAAEPVARTECTTAGSSAPATQAVSSAPLFTLNEHDPWYALDSVPEDDDIYDDEPAVPVALPAFLMAAAEASGHASGASAQQVGGETLIEEKPLPVPPAAQQDDPQAPVEHYTPAPCTVPRGTQEGKSSLCTRSMARVLEEQGATSEAADIYRELLASCSSDEERDELNAKLDSLLQGADPAASAAAISAGQPSPGVLDMLEELAVRLETRSRA